MKLILVAIFCFYGFSANAGNVNKSYKNITFLCNFKELGDMRIDVNLKNKSAKVSPLTGDFRYYINPSWNVTSHFDADGKRLQSVRVNDNIPQMVLVGNNSDDSNFTLNIAYSFGRPVVATFNAYWDGLDGTHEVYETACAELDWAALK